MSAAFSFIVAALIGYCGVRLWLPADDVSSRWTTALQVTLGFGLGAGFSSCLYWLLVVKGSGAVPVIAGLELSLLAALAALVWRRRAPTAAGRHVEASSAFPLWIPGTGFAAMMGLLVTAFVRVSDLNPQGGWDAFAIWNLRARFLLHPETWKYAVTSVPVGTHMEYPLLMSSLVARGWTYAGSPSTIVPVATAFLFAVGLVLVLVSVLSLTRGAALGLLAGVILLATPTFVDQAPSQYADVPLAFFFLSALALIVLAGERPGQARYLSLAGVFAGFAAWTKNEGALLLIALAAALFAGAWRSAGWRSAVRQSGIFLLGALPGLLLVAWFKMAVAPPDPLAGQIVVAGQKLADAGRWIQVAAGFLKQAWKQYVFPGPPLILLAVTCGLLRLRPRGERAAAPLVAVLVVLAGYFAIFLITRDDLEWLLATALDRLYLQVWPALLLAVFVLLRRPEDFAIPIAPPKSKKAR